MKTSIIFLSSLFLIVCFSSFQNCAQHGLSTGDSNQYLTLASDIGQDHLVEVKPELTQQKILVVNREYVASLIREIFSTHNATADKALENYINNWIYYHGDKFGGACSQYNSTVGSDCAGTLSNINIKQYVDQNVIRESYRIQLCQTIMNEDQFVQSALQKINISVSTEPNLNNVADTFELFYRAGNYNRHMVQVLVEMDMQLKNNNEILTDRWRAILLQVCESHGWQTF